jgi:hypothetical protein
MLRPLASIASLGLASAAAAQGIPFTLTSSCTGNGVFTLPSIPTSSTASAGALPIFRATGTTGADQLFESWWWYRTTTDTREHTFNNSATSGFAGAVVSAKGDSAILRWTNVDGKGFDAQLVYRIYSTGPSSAVVSQTLTIANPTTSPLGIVLFNYSDFDVGATAGGDSATFVPPAFPPNRQQEITDATSPVRCYFLGCGPSAYQTGAFATIRSLLTNAAVDNFTDTGVPFGPADWTSGYQWRLAVPPNSRESVSAGLAIDFAIPCCEVAAVNTYCNGKPGTNGLPTWGNNPLFVGGQTELKVLNGLAGASPIVLIGAGPQVCVPLPPFGTLAVSPILANFMMPPFNTSNNSQLCITVPNNPGLCGGRLYMQAWFADPAAAGFPVAHTDGAEFVIGSL